MSNVLRSRSFTYEARFKSGNDIDVVDDAESENDGDCESRLVDGEVDAIRLETGLTLGFVGLSTMLVEGEAIDGDDVESTEGDEDEDGCTRKSCGSVDVSGHCCCDKEEDDGEERRSSGLLCAGCCCEVCPFTLTLITVLNVKWCVGVCAICPVPLLAPPPHSISIF